MFVVFDRPLSPRSCGSLTIEFDPEPLPRIAGGDEVWIDLNPEARSR